MSITKEPIAPKSLLEYEKWFSKTISSPLKNMHHITQSDGAEQFIRPSNTLSAKQRIQVYAQQYWWRLLNCLQANFPSLTASTGQEKFQDKIALPYLQQHPPAHWSLNSLGDTLPDWMEIQKYPALLCDLAKTDAASTIAFFSPQETEPDSFSAKELTSCLYFLQPKVCLINSNYPLYALRKELLKKRYSTALPEKGQMRFFVLYRSRKLTILWEEIDSYEFSTLQLLQSPLSLENFGKKIEENTKLFAKAEKNLSSWFQKWTTLGWIAVKQKL